MNDNQIIKETWMETMVRQAEESLRTLTIRKPVVTNIPITVWTEVKQSDIYDKYKLPIYPHTPICNRFNWHKMLEQKHPIKHDDAMLEDFFKKYMVCQKCGKSTRQYDSEVYGSCLTNQGGKTYLVTKEHNNVN